MLKIQNLANLPKNLSICITKTNSWIYFSAEVDFEKNKNYLGTEPENVLVTPWQFSNWVPNANRWHRAPVWAKCWQCIYEHSIAMLAFCYNLNMRYNFLVILLYLAIHWKPSIEIWWIFLFFSSHLWQLKTSKIT